MYTQQSLARHVLTLQEWIKTGSAVKIKNFNTWDVTKLDDASFKTK